MYKDPQESVPPSKKTDVIANTTKITRNKGQLKKIEKKDKGSDLLFSIVKLLKKINGAKNKT
tara:strand:+ start:506 stop:691 length:186 start_codon:yes stop_codon:yes gene_type:complete